MHSQQQYCTGQNPRVELLGFCINTQYQNPAFQNDRTRHGRCTITLAPFNVMQNGHIEYLTTVPEGIMYAEFPT